MSRVQGHEVYAKHEGPDGLGVVMVRHLTQDDRYHVWPLGLDGKPQMKAGLFLLGRKLATSAYLDMIQRQLEQL